MRREVALKDSAGVVRRAVLRTCTRRDASRLETEWGPLLERGPRSWLDREWAWSRLDDPREIAFSEGAEWVVLADEIEADALGDLLGVLVTTGPHTAATVDLGHVESVDGPLCWIEYIAIAPCVRPDCPSGDRREPVLKGVGVQLRAWAIERSRSLGCEGRLGLHAEGEIAAAAYRKWEMVELPAARHPAGGSFPVFYGGRDWAEKFGMLRG